MRTKQMDALETFEDQSPVPNADTCDICLSPAARYQRYYLCQANSGHFADVETGVYRDMTHLAIEAMLLGK